ncbi:hypothetical protein BH10CYA1_BH10CYA1_36700 [soil metagenome]
MKTLSLYTAIQSTKKLQRGLRLRSAMLAVLFAFASSSVQPATAADRIVQILGRCGNSSAQYIGNRRHGGSELISFAPDGDAGVVIEGLEGKKISQLNTIFAAFEPPKIDTSYNFHLRIKVADPEVNRIQNFTIGPDNNPNLPNLPTRNDSSDGSIQGINIQRHLLLEGKSKLKETDVILKVSLIFSSAKKNTKETLFIDEVRYAGFPVYVLLEPVTCNLK